MAPAQAGTYGWEENRSDEAIFPSVSTKQIRNLVVTVHMLIIDVSGSSVFEKYVLLCLIEKYNSRV